MTGSYRNVITIPSDERFVATTLQVKLVVKLQLLTIRSNTWSLDKRRGRQKGWFYDKVASPLSTILSISKDAKIGDFIGIIGWHYQYFITIYRT